MLVNLVLRTMLSTRGGNEEGRIEFWSSQVSPSPFDFKKNCWTTSWIGSNFGWFSLNHVRVSDGSDVLNQFDFLQKFGSSLIWVGWNRTDSSILVRFVTSRLTLNKPDHILSV